MSRHFLSSAFAVAVVALSSNLAQAQTMMSDAALPLNARPGECYARVYTAPQFRTVTDTVIKKAASERVNVIPERYDWTEETVMVKPASERIAQVIPAEYRWEEEQVLVKPASEKIEEVPATYKTVTQTELVKAATTEWKRGRGPVEKVDNLTGDIMCLVEVPAEYRTITRSEVDQPASTRRVTIPAEYQTVRRQVLVKEAEVRKETVPAQYQTVKVRKLVEAAREERIAIPPNTRPSRARKRSPTATWSGARCSAKPTPRPKPSTPCRTRSRTRATRPARSTAIWAPAPPTRCAATRRPTASPKAASRSKCCSASA